MAEFEVKVVRIDAVEEHPNADRLTLNRIGGYTCISNKHEDGSWRYQPGDLAVYIPENAVVPERILRTLNMWNDEKDKGILAGKQGDRVKAIRLRGIYSEGILLPVVPRHSPSGNFVELPAIAGKTDSWPASRIEVTIGWDVADALGIYKYEPPIPMSMSGEVFSLVGVPVKYDIEPIEKYPDTFWSDEIVSVTEKCHGTFTAFAICKGLNNDNAFPTPDGDRDIVVYSKGLGSGGLVFKDSEVNGKNLYVRTMRAVVTGAFWNAFQNSAFSSDDITEVHFLGETFGPGVQDLHYGLKQPEFRLFDIFIRWKDQTRGEYLSIVSVAEHARVLGLTLVPQLFFGPYCAIGDLAELRDGLTTVSEGSHIREGVVIRPAMERCDEAGPGRVILKAVSPDYKLRKGNTTEFN